MTGLGCDCPDLVVNEFLDADGNVVDTRTSDYGTGARDADDYLAMSNVVAFRIVCPACRFVYAQGTKGHGVVVIL